MAVFSLERSGRMLKTIGTNTILQSYRSMAAFAASATLLASLILPSFFGRPLAPGAPGNALPSVDSAYLPDFNTLPLSFEPNAGQTDPQVRFQARIPGGVIFFTPQEVVLSLATR